jgi:hypothetical protein
MFSVSSFFTCDTHCAQHSAFTVTCLAISLCLPLMHVELQDCIAKVVRTVATVSSAVTTACGYSEASAALAKYKVSVIWFMFKWYATALERIKQGHVCNQDQKRGNANWYPVHHFCRVDDQCRTAVLIPKWHETVISSFWFITWPYVLTCTF